MYDEPKNSNNKEMKRQMNKGERGGRLQDGSNKWKYFFKGRKDFLSQEERNLHKSESFKGIKEPSDIQDEYQQEKQQNTNTSYQLVNMKRLKEIINRTCVCTCRLNKYIVTIFFGIALPVTKT